MSGEATEGARKPGAIARFLPLALILAALGGAYALGLHKYLSFETLRDQRETLGAMVESNPVLAGAVFIGVYLLFTAAMVPGALWVTIAGGFLFGLGVGSALTLVGATAGATALFLAARSAIGEPLRRRAGPFLKRLEHGFADNPFSYMLTLRFLPVVPFPVANIAPALLGAKLRDYVVATFIGIIPGVVAYTWIGAGLGEAFAAGKAPDIAGVVRPLLPAFFALAAVSLAPILVKRFTKARAS